MLLLYEEMLLHQFLGSLVQFIFSSLIGKQLFHRIYLIDEHIGFCTESFDLKDFPLYTHPSISFSVFLKIKDKSGNGLGMFGYEVKTTFACV